jgi:Zn-dependent M28 family amino/carboxypeptidase
MNLCRWLRWQRTVLIALAVLVVVPLRAEEAARPTREEESEARLKHDIFFIGGPECEGRGPTTEGIKKASDYIANEFRKAGLKPGNPDGTYFQNYTINGAIKEGPAHLVLRAADGRIITLKEGVHFEAMGLGAAGKLAGLPMVFAGYGITSVPDPKNARDTRPDYDDYAGLDVEGKVVVILRDIPRTTNTEFAGPASPFRRMASLTSKIFNAEKHKAAAVLLVNDANTAKAGDDLMDFNFTAVGGNLRAKDPADGAAKIPALHVHRSVLELLLGGEGALSSIETDIDRDMMPASKELTAWKADAEVQMKRDRLPLRNVIGVLEGKGPLANETIYVGAHYDHLGYGGAGGSLAGVKKPTMHNGADDNGSGTTGVMELARRFGAMKNREGRRIVFMTYSGEELGLIGSDYYTSNPLIPLDNAVFMLNLDMIGRLRPSTNDPKRDLLLTEGLGTGKDFEKLVDGWNKTHGFDLKKTAAAIPYSDHYSFYKKKVPVMFFWTNYHQDYHRPSDTPDKINVQGMRRIVDLSEDVLSYFATVPEKPVWQEVKGGGPTRPSRGPTLGIAPRYGGTDGLEVETVTDGRPAAKAGVKAGDKIVEIAGKPVKTIETYQEAMATQKPGDTIDVVVVRGKEKVTLKVKLEQ